MDHEKILVVDDDQASIKNLARLLSRDGREVQTAGSGAEARDRLAHESFDLVITDLVMDDISGLDVLAAAKHLRPGAEVIIITGHASIPTAIEAMRHGAFYYLEKPFRPEQLRSLADRALEKSRLSHRVSELESRLGSDPAGPVIVGTSREMSETVKLLRQVAETDCNVLLMGESGSGKELAARLIHFESRRAQGRFMAINCGAFSEELLANELFGHEKDAYTGAGSARPGLLEAASGGSLLLDEVGDMPLSMQVKLLRAIQEQEVIRLGGTRPVPIDVRVIAATNQDLKKAVSAGLFRRDLFFRLNVISIRVPPLRERKDDVPVLANYFLKKTCARWGREVGGFSKEAASILAHYNYPGNVRELENIVERAVAVCRADRIEPGDLPPDLGDLEVFSFTSGDDQVRTLDEIKAEYIQWVLEKTGRNKTQAAQLLGIDRASLWRHLKRQEIED